MSKFLNTIEDPTKKDDCKEIARMMEEITKEKPYMWGEGIVGFGTYTYTYADKSQRDWFLCGFAPRKSNITLYILKDLDENQDLLSQLGKHKTGKSCLYIRKLEDIDLKVLRELIERSVDLMKND